MLAAFKGKPFPYGRTSLEVEAFDNNTYSYDGTALAAFQVNSLPLWWDGVCRIYTSSSWTALATFEGFGLVWFMLYIPGKQFFSHVGTEPPLPGYYQYFLAGKYVLLKDITRGPESGSNPNL